LDESKSPQNILVDG